MDVGRQVPAVAGEEAQSEASEWELREQRGREEEMKQETEELDAEAEQPLFLPTPSFMASVEGECRRFSFVFPFCLFVLLPPLLFPWRALSFLGQAQAEGKGEPAASRRCADSRQEPVKIYPAIVYMAEYEYDQTTPPPFFFTPPTQRFFPITNTNESAPVQSKFAVVNTPSNVEQINTLPSMTASKTQGGQTITL